MATNQQILDFNVAHARKSDPATSHRAAAKVVNLGRTRDAILRILSNHGPQTDEGIAMFYQHAASYDIRVPNASPSGLRSRRSELVRMGLVVDSGQRGTTASGRPTIIWKVKQ